MSEEIEPDSWCLRVEDVMEMLSLYFHHEDRFSSRYGNKKKDPIHRLTTFFPVTRKTVPSVCHMRDFLSFSPSFRTRILFRPAGYSCPHVSLLTLLFLPLL